MLYQFKSQPSDFIVEELLSVQPSGKGDVLYVFFQKENLTTMEVLEHLQRSFPLSREDFGIAGLKDKVGITRQWITVFRSRLESVGGESAFLFVLSERVKVLEVTRGEKPLRIGGNAGNRFAIRLCASASSLDGGVRAEKKNLILQNVEQVKAKGFPNCFGVQRFGKGMKNFWEAKEVLCWQTLSPSGSSPLAVGAGQALSGGTATSVSYHLRFMLQAFASGWFNEYVMRRRDKGQHLLNGDIVVDRYQPEGARVGVYENGGVKVVDYERLKKRNEEKGIWEISENFLVDSPSCAATTRKPLWTPTGPMVGWNLLVPSMGSKARVREEQLFEVAGFDEQVLARGKAYHLRGVRRPLWVRVEDLEVWFEGNDCLLHFSLPTGSYATVLLAFVLAGVDALTLKDNRLEIPRVVKNRQL